MPFASQRGLVRGLVAVVLGTACTAIDYADGGGAAGAGTSVAGGGGSSAGAGPSVGGQGGAPPCQPGAQELCNGFDDDCDGIADNPPGGVGTVCPEMTWEAAPDGRLYVSIPMNGDDASTLTCPTGMEPVVLQSQEELSFLEVFVPLEGDLAVLGARQEPQRSHRAEGWSWVRPGIPMPWVAGDPDDYRPNEPAFFENDDEDCGGLYHGPANIGFVDLPCNGGASGVFVCEQVGDSGVPGGTCLLDEGCVGTWDTAGTTCNPQPHGETCNGLDDDCNGALDEDVACQCELIVDSMSGRQYKDCSINLLAADAHCGDGFRLALPETTEELTFLLQRENQVNAGQHRFVGLYQPLGSAAADVGWIWLTGAPVVAGWGNGQPTDFPTFGEQDEQNCGSLLQNQGPGLHDEGCANPHRYFCEQWP